MPRALRAPLLAVGCVAVAGLASLSCGSGSGAVASGAATAIPPDPLVFVAIDISGEGEQHENLDTVLSELGQVPLLGTPLEPKGLIAGALEDAAGRDGVEFSFAEDVEPWLGHELAVGYTSLAEGDERFVLSLETTDEGLAREAVERITEEDPAEESEAEHEGVSYMVGGAGEYGVGVFDGNLVLATPEDFPAAIDASRGESVGSEGAFGDELGQLAAERVASVVIDANGLLELAVAEGELLERQAEAVRGGVPELVAEPVVAALTFGKRDLALDVAFGHDGSDLIEASGLLSAAPADAFAAGAASGLGAALRRTLDELDESVGVDHGEVLEDELGVPLGDLLDSFGDLLVYGRGAPPGSFSVRAEIDTVDRQVATELVGGLEALAGDDEGTTVGPALGVGATGFSAEPAKAAPHAVLRFAGAELRGDRLTLLAASDREEAKRPPTDLTLGTSHRYQAATDALGDEFEPLAFVDLEPVLDAVFDASLLDVATGAASPEEAIGGYLASKLGYAVAGISYRDDLAVQRLIVGLR